MAKLLINNREVSSPFGLLGTDENALTFALGFTFQQSPRLLQWFLNKIGINGIRTSMLRNVEISLQRRRSDSSKKGITDVEIVLNPHFHVIIEAKVGTALPSEDQCRKYIDTLDASEGSQNKLVILVESPEVITIERYKRTDPALVDRVVCFNWTELIPELVRLTVRPQDQKLDSSNPSELGWLQAFYRFLDQEYRMKAFSTEVWILPISTEAVCNNGDSFWKLHLKHRLVWDHQQPGVRPLYLGFRVNGQVDAIYRVLKVDHVKAIDSLVPELSQVKEGWTQGPVTVWHFGDAVPLNSPVTTGSGMYNRRIRCDLDLLLTCRTLVEVESGMKERREKSNDED